MAVAGLDPHLFLTTTDPFVRQLMIQVLYRAEEIRRNDQTSLANQIANKVDKGFGGK